MQYAVKHSFTDEELIQRVTDVMEIRNLMGRHVYYHARGMHEQELRELWVQKPENQATASFGQNQGYHVGMESIDAYYGRGSVENFQKDLEALAAADPTVAVTPENRGIGSLAVHMLTAPYIEVAGDGQTAQGLWYSPGAVGGAHPDHDDGLMIYEKYGVDFMREDGEWKIWHLFVGTDFAVPAGQDLKGDTILETERKIAAGEIDPPAPQTMVQSDDPGFLPMDAYSLKYNYSFYPPLPEPYYSFDECTSNGPEGNPNYHKEG